MLLRKGNLLHVMTEGSTCPSQSKMVPPISQFLKKAKIEQLTSVKIYGRRSGQKSPLWRCGLSLISTSSPAGSPVETPQMEFTPSTPEAGVLTTQAGELVFRPNLPLIHLEQEEESQPQHHSASRWQTQLDRCCTQIQQNLIATGLFSTVDPALVNHRSTGSASVRVQKASLGLAWGALGCLLVWQADLILAKLVQWQEAPGSFDSVVNSGTTATEWNNPSTAFGVTNNSRMSSMSPGNLAGIYPTFNSPQLDEQLTRYQNYIARHQQPVYFRL